MWDLLTQIDSIKVAWSYMFKIGDDFSSLFLQSSSEVCDADMEIWRICAA